MSISQFRPEKDHPLQLQVTFGHRFGRLVSHHCLLFTFFQAMYELRSLLLDDEPMWNRVRKD